MSKDIVVGIAEYRIACWPDKIITLGLGSCVGICIYDTLSMIGGMAHIMLPDSNQLQKEIRPEKFANLAIPKMVSDLEAAGVVIGNMAAKIAGGASMFRFLLNSREMDIGKRNVIAVRKSLKHLGIPILAEDIGGHTSRTMVLDLKHKIVMIRRVGQEIIIL